MSPPDLATWCADRLGYSFDRPELIAEAITHRSFANEQGREEQYERLEFLGDAILGLVASEWLFDRFTDLPEGPLSRLRSSLVSESALAFYARSIGLGEVVRLGVGEDRSGGRDKASILADAMEAVIGAVYLDGGLEEVRELTVRLLEAGERERDRHHHGDAKTVLQELSQARGLELPRYIHVAHEGPDHERLFMVDCWIDGDRVGSGTGRSKKQAEQRAAAAALSDLQEP
jgi:ribonuclease-3